MLFTHPELLELRINIAALKIKAGNVASPFGFVGAPKIAATTSFVIRESWKIVK